MHQLFVRSFYIGLVGCLLTILTMAQAETCPAIVQTVVDTADDICSATGRNQVCFVNWQANITPQDPTMRIKFDQPSDLVNLEYIETMVMSPLNTLDETWGVSLMKLQANLPDTLPGQNVTMLLFGDVEIRNEVDSTTTPVTLPATSTTNANVRVAPSTSAGVIRALSVNEAISLDGRNSDGTWVRLALGNSTSGWVFADLLTTEGDVMTLTSVVAGEVDTALKPMQAFYFRTGISDSACASAPESGIIVQTLGGGQKIKLTANGVDISLGSTAFLQAQPLGEFSMAVVEGEGLLTVAGETVVVPAGSQSSVPLDENGEASGPPSPAEPYDADKMSQLPIKALSENIEIAEPLTAEELEAIVSPPVIDSGAVMADMPMGFNNMWIPGLSEGCMNLMNQFVEAATANDINRLIALEAEFTGSSCEAELDAIANMYGGMEDESSSDDEDGDTGE